MASQSRSDNSLQSTRPVLTAAAPCLLFGAAVAVTITLLAPRIWLVLLTEGLCALAVTAAAAGWGAWPCVWLGLCRRRATQQICLALGLGLGIVALLTLLLGVGGLLNRPVAWVLVGIGWGLGLWRIHAAQTAGGRLKTEQIARTQIAWRTLALMALVPAAAIALFGASLPPGILWPGEAGGYDALEYHLQCPREYYEAGRIHFLTHNVYASFPQQMEMLYLLLMHLVGDLNQAAVTAQLLHALTGLAAIIAIAAWQPAGWSALTAALAAGGVGWLAYLGCLAYVELGVLLFGVLAAGLLIENIHNGKAVDWKTALTAGILAGLAGGCKYTALALIAAALGIAWMVAMRGSAAVRIRSVALYAFGAALAFSPWLIRNAVFTGNPVFPFAYEWFDGWIDADVWSAEQAAQWTEGHRFKTDGGVAARAGAAFRELFASSKFGWGIFAAAVAGALAQRGRRSVMLLIWAVLMIGVWTFATHIPGRFIVPIVAPLAMLAGGIGLVRRMRSRRLVMGVVAVLAAVSGVRLAAEFHGINLRRGRMLSVLVGATDAMSEFNTVNLLTPPDARVWMVGEARGFYVRRAFHYTVVFNRDPWIAIAQRGGSPAECIDWLRRREVTHVLFSWPEIERLRGTYGFSHVVTHEWVNRLVGAGLVPVPASGIPDGSLYEVIGP